MKYQILKPQEIELVWPHIAEWVDISRGADKSFSVADIHAACANGQYELWVVTEGIEYFGFLIGCIIPAPRAHVYYGAWLGGKDLAKWVKEGVAAVEKHAKQNGCVSYSFVGRKAWQRLLGYDYEGVFYFKNI